MISHAYYQIGIHIWIYFANFDTLKNVKIKLRQKSILYCYAFHVVKRRKLPSTFWYVVHAGLTSIWRWAGSNNVLYKLIGDWKGGKLSLSLVHTSKHYNFNVVHQIHRMWSHLFTYRMFILIVKHMEEICFAWKGYYNSIVLVCISAHCISYAVQSNRAVLTHGSMKIRVIKSVQLYKLRFEK